MRLLATFLALLLTASVQGQGTLIWSSPNFTSIVGNNPDDGPVPNREIAIDHVSDSNVPTSPSVNPVTGIFFLTISTNDAGRTFFTDALNSPGFAGFVAGLTDGTNGFIRFADVNYSVGWGTGNEAGILGRPSSSPDFAGYNITQIGFRVTDYYDWFYAPEHRYLNTLDYSLDFYGAPVLFIQRVGASQVEVSWSTNASGFTLESASTLPPSSWSSVTNSTQLVGGRFAVRVDGIAQQRFFRLRRQ